MVILASIGTSMWWAVVVLIPYIGAIALGVWLAFVLPPRHGRFRWWTVPFLVPIVNLVAFFAYAFTLQRVPSDQALERGAALSPPGQLVAATMARQTHGTVHCRRSDDVRVRSQSEPSQQPCSPALPSQTQCSARPGSS